MRSADVIVTSERLPPTVSYRTLEMGARRQGQSIDVNRELNIVRGCLSRAVKWGRLGVSPLRTVKPYRVDDVRLRVCSPEDIKTLLDGAPAGRAVCTRR
jgi:hypothetical protein